MTRKAEGRHRWDGKRPVSEALKTPEIYHGQAKNANIPRLNPLAVIALRRYRDELTRLEITREVSGLVDCCDVILLANEGGRHDRQAKSA